MARTYVAEYTSSPLSISQGTTVTLTVPLRRMRQQGRANVLRASAFQATFTDEVHLKIEVRPTTAASSGGLQYVEATIKIRRYAFDSGTAPDGTYPGNTYDVSGLLQSMGGVLDLDLSDEPVWDLQFALTNRSATAFAGVIYYALTGAPIERDLVAERGVDVVTEVAQDTPETVGNVVDADRTRRGG